MTSKLYLIKGNDHGGSSVYATVLNYKFLKGRVSVPIYKTQSKTGYQRIAKGARVRAVCNKIMNYFNNPSPLIDSINLNVRDKELEKTQLTLIDGNGSPGSLYELKWPTTSKVKFNIVDGQTRFSGVEELWQIYDQKGDNAKKYKVECLTFQVNLTFLDKIWDEAFTFMSINKHAKKVDTTLSERVIHEAISDGHKPFQNEIKGDPKYKHRISCNNISDNLADTSPIWAFPRIKDANQERVEKPNVTFEAMSRFVEPVFLALDNMYKAAGQIKTNTQLEKHTEDSINAFWEGLYMVYHNIPNNLSKYSIQKSSLAEVLFELHAKLIIEPHHSMEKFNRYSPKDYEKLLKKTLINLKESNKNGKDVSSEDFWVVGDDGAAGKYTSAAAKKALTQQLWDAVRLTKP